MKSTKTVKDNHAFLHNASCGSTSRHFVLREFGAMVDVVPGQYSPMGRSTERTLQRLRTQVEAEDSALSPKAKVEKKPKDPKDAKEQGVKFCQVLLIFSINSIYCMCFNCYFKSILVRSQKVLRERVWPSRSLRRLIKWTSTASDCLTKRALVNQPHSSPTL